MPKIPLPASAIADSGTGLLACNLVMLHGVVSGPVQERTLADGSTSRSFRLAGAAGAERWSVPVVVGPGVLRALSLVDGDSVTVVGQVRQRFFRSAGATVSRTEVVASSCRRGRWRASLAAGLLEQVRTSLGAP